jgi:hypothetical protein
MIRELSSLDLELNPPVLLTSSVSVLLTFLTNRDGGEIYTNSRGAEAVYSLEC